ncbi:MAG: hypothetical protein KDJ65_20890 [Anaerolineae bacterium]|nr:hypothetical protein [Anaerolineae bacterium]
MNNRNKYKGLALLTFLVILIPIGLLSDSILALNPVLLSVILITYAILGVLIFVFVMLDSITRGSWPVTRKNIFHWIISFSLVIIPVSGATVWLSLEGLKEIWLQEAGVLTQANILHLETGISRGSEFCKITYQWKLIEENVQIREYKGTGRVYIKQSKCMSLGEETTIRYLPLLPIIFRIEIGSDNATRIAISSLMMSLFLIFTLPSYMLVEGINIK